MCVSIGNRSPAHAFGASEFREYDHDRILDFGFQLSGPEQLPDASGDGFVLQKTVSSWQSQSSTGNDDTGDYTLTTAADSYSVANETSTNAAGSATFTESIDDNSTNVETGNSITGDYVQNITDTTTTADTDAGSDATGTFSVTESSSQTTTGTQTGNHITADYSLNEAVTNDYSMSETATDADGSYYTLTEAGNWNGTIANGGNTLAGNYANSTTGEDSYTMTENGTTSGVAFNETVVGNETFAESEIGNSANQTYSRTITGTGVAVVTGTGVTTGTNDYTYATMEVADARSGVLNQTQTGITRYNILQRYNDVSNTNTGSSPGNMNFVPYGQPFVDPSEAELIDQIGKLQARLESLPGDDRFASYNGKTAEQRRQEAIAETEKKLEDATAALERIRANRAPRGPVALPPRNAPDRSWERLPEIMARIRARVDADIDIRNTELQTIELERQRQEQRKQQLLRLAIYLMPINGEVLALTEAFAGKDVFGNNLGTTERVVLGAGAVLSIGFRTAGGILSEAQALAATRQPLLAELARQGIRHTPENIVFIMRTASGRIVFLETGTSSVGLQHIIGRHAADFAARGISQEQIPAAIQAALTEGRVVGTTGSGGNLRNIYEFVFGGRTQRIAIGIGDNGFIVTGFPN